MKGLTRSRAISLPHNLGISLLAGWLIASGVVPLLGIHSALLGNILAVVAIAAGVCLLLNK